MPFSLLSVSSRENCIARLEPIFNKLKASFKILLLKYEFGDCPLILIDIKNIQENTDDLTQSTHSDATNSLVALNLFSNPLTQSTHSDTANTKVALNVDSNQQIDSDIQGGPSGTQILKQTSNITTETGDSSLSVDSGEFNSFVDDDGEQTELNFNSDKNLNSSIIERVKMPQSAREFMSMAGPVLNYKFDGNALKLETFLTDIDLVESLAEDDQKTLCFKFVKSKLEGRALEAMPEDLTTID